MSTLYVDNLEPNLTSGVHVPGHVIQVQQTIYDAQVTLGSDGKWIDVMSGSITPLFNDSKIIVEFDTGGIAYSSQDASIRILRSVSGSDTEIVKRARQGYNSLGNWDGIPFHVVYMDSPTTTSQITYKVQAKKTAGSLELGSGGAGGDLNRMTLLMSEIAQ